MGPHVNKLMVLLRAPASCGIIFQRQFLVPGRRLHSDVNMPSVAAVRAAPAEEARPPLTDLLGRQHNYLRISLTERCNLRCKYCMPAEGVPLSARSALLSRAELTRAVRCFAALGVRKVRLTGGEPTLRQDLADIIQEISSVEGISGVSMTTNGLVLVRRLAALQRAGLGAVNVSLDSLRPERYERMARRPGLPRVLAGIDLALQLGYRPVKINVVLMKGFNDDEICDFVEFTRDRAVEVRFIEFMPFSGNAWDGGKMVPHRDAVRAFTQRYPDAQPTLPRPHDTARVWQVPGYEGSVGFISSMTKNFCSTCNRLRLTADGNLKVCLFGAAEVSIRDAIRNGASDEELELLIRTALRNKKPQHAESRANGEPSHDSDRGLALMYMDVALAAPEGGPQGLRDFGALAPVGGFLSSKTTLGSKDVALAALKGLDPLNPRDSAALTPVGGLLSPNFSSPLTKISPLLTLRTRTPVASARWYSSEADEAPTLSHLDASGRARMVDVSAKEITSRRAEAHCELKVGARLLRLLKDARLPKGDALSVAQIAGVMAAKCTSGLIPMCHPLPLNYARVTISLPRGECADGGAISVRCEVRTEARTGAEMEALTGATIAALTLYDMCKAVDKRMMVTNVRLVHKSGGASGTWPKSEPEQETEIKLRDHDTTKHKSGETYVPTNLMHF